MSILQKHGVNALLGALKATENKKKGISGETEKIREKLKMIMDAVENPVPNREMPNE